MATGTATLADVEAAVREITASVLDLPDVECDANLLELGVDSFVATRIVAALRTRFDTEVPLILLFEEPEVAVFAESVHDLVVNGPED
ncbi:phosphopantetheine-binding protein [Streptomyces sp. NPDC008150]|uniref:phosphopantetheine-binding protein n=1 Tax=Streptomyces sp. NPDC008150 TaxID=3364816 RepID=UPI0036ED6E8B